MDPAEPLHPEIAYLLEVARAANASGNLATALEKYAASLDALLRCGRASVAGGVALEASLCASKAGDAFLASHYFHHASLLALECGASLDTGEFAFARAEWAVARGNCREALNDYALAMDRFAEVDKLEEVIGVIARYAQVFSTVASVGDSAIAHQLVVNAVRAFPQLEERGEIIAAGHLSECGRAHRRNGEHEAALAALVEASDIYRDNGMLVEAARLDYEVGSLCVDIGNEDFALVCFQEARMAFGVLGMKPEHDRAIRALEYLGHSTRRDMDGLNR
ncbi:MAG: hypothetical protein ACOYN3_02075 [Acidimicrobiia bacterium]